KKNLTIDNDAQGQAKDYTNLFLELEEGKKNLIDFEYQKVQYSEIIIENKQRIIELELLNESLLSKKELLSVIQTLLGSLNEANHPQFKGIKSKSKGELLSILQQVKDLYNGNDNNEAEDMI
ncbi:8238_t:CDS:1, partial [Entrophospora sp. SA101]